MSKIVFGVIGEYQTGKSLLINCLLERSIAVVGDGRATTHTIVRYLYAQEEYAEYVDKNSILHKTTIDKVMVLQNQSTIALINIYIDNPLLLNYSLIDMPGLGYNEDDNSFSKSTLTNLDFALVIASNYKAVGGEDSPYYKDIYLLMQHGVPYYFILNCTDTDKWNPDNEFNETIFRTNMKYLSFYNPITYPIEKSNLPIVNFVWYWYYLHLIESSSRELKTEDKLILRYKRAFYEYGLFDDDVRKRDIYEASNFDFILKIFNMENKAYLELKNEIRRLKDELCPVGTIQAFAFDKIPNGWLACDGKPLDIEMFPQLYDAIGVTFGGDGKVNFCLPDLRDKFIRGWNMNNSERKFGSPQDDALQGHGHKSKPQTTSSSGEHSHRVYYDKKNVGSNTFTADDLETRIVPTVHVKSDPLGADPGTDTNGNHTHKIPGIQIKEIIDGNYKEVRVDYETRPKNLALMFCIKAIP